MWTTIGMFTESATAGRMHWVRLDVRLRAHSFRTQLGRHTLLNTAKDFYEGEGRSLFKDRPDRI